ncbi:biliverdin-producing heme oxygenase [Nocardia sp. KC 131]|uniref:biliverdin-producing heme oxygenase n=1 Tax=Nocardia arseniciresistens TaxID=3392119 RepID=UPI00398EB86E
MTDTIMQRLRTETRTWHEALEATAFSSALLNRTLPLERYVAQLAAYRIVLETLETQLAESADPTIVAVWRGELAKTHLVELDLEFFDTVPNTAIPVETLDVAQGFASSIRHHGSVDPASLLGFLYVMEGSTLGGLELAPHVRATFELEGSRGMAYYSSGDRARWAQFGARMNAAPTGRATQDSMLTTADIGYRWIADTIATLSRDDQPDSALR